MGWTFISFLNWALVDIWHNVTFKGRCDDLITFCFSQRHLGCVKFYVLMKSSVISFSLPVPLHPLQGHLIYCKVAKVSSRVLEMSPSLSLIFRSVTLVELIVIYSVRKGSISHTFILLLRRLSFERWIVLEPLSKIDGRASLVVQWLRICLPMQGTQVQSLIQKIPHAADQRSPRATTIEPELQSPGAAATEAWVPQSPCSTAREATAVRSPRSPQLEKAHTQQRRPSTAQINKSLKKNQRVTDLWVWRWSLSASLVYIQPFPGVSPLRFWWFCSTSWNWVVWVQLCLFQDGFSISRSLALPDTC